MSFELFAYRGRTGYYNGVLGGAVVALAADDRLRVRVALADGTALVVTEGSPSPAGSVVTVSSRGSGSAAATYAVRLDAADLEDVPVEANPVEVSVVHGDGEEETVEEGVLHMAETP